MTGNLAVQVHGKDANFCESKQSMGYSDQSKSKAKTSNCIPRRCLIGVVIVVVERIIVVSKVRSGKKAIDTVPKRPRPIQDGQDE